MAGAVAVSRALPGDRSTGLRLPLLLGGVTCRCATPKRGAHADNAAKGSCEMRLICESACQCNMRQPLPRGGHHEFGALDSSRRDIRHGRGSKALFERSREMTQAQSHEIGHVAHLDLQSKMVLYVLDSPPGLPSRETTRPQNTVQRWRITAKLLLILPRGASRHPSGSAKRPRDSTQKMP